MAKKVYMESLKDEKKAMMQEALDLFFMEASAQDSFKNRTKELSESKKDLDARKATNEEKVMRLTHAVSSLTAQGLDTSKVQIELDEAEKESNDIFVGFDLVKADEEELDRRKKALRDFMNKKLYDTFTGKDTDKIVHIGLFTQLGIDKSFETLYMDTDQNRAKAVKKLLADYGLENLKNNLIKIVVENLRIVAGKVSTGSSDTLDGKLLKNPNLKAFQKIFGRAVCLYCSDCCKTLHVRDSKTNGCKIDWGYDELYSYEITYFELVEKSAKEVESKQVEEVAETAETTTPNTENGESTPKAE